MKLSIIIPVFNEKKTIKTIIKKVVAIKRIKKEIIIVDDYSTDGTREILKNIHYREVKKILLHNRNIGKGGAIKTARKYLDGDIVIIQDADLEYNPKDYHKLLRPFEKAKTQVVYGSRVLKKPEDFVIATGKTYSIKDFINESAKYLNLDVKWTGKGTNTKLLNNKNNNVIIKINKKLFRPSEVNYTRGNINKAKKIIKWKPKISFKMLIKIMIDDELKNYDHK